MLDPVVLSRLEQQGFALSALVLGKPAATTLELDQTAFHDIFDALRADLARAKHTFPLARPTSIDGFRLFDARWLASKEMSFELSGVFNRLDRRAFYAGTCGEVRFLYPSGTSAGARSNAWPRPRARGRWQSSASTSIWLAPRPIARAV